MSAIDLWEQSFFQSEFTHASGVRKHIRFRGGLPGDVAVPRGAKSVSSEVSGEVAADDLRNS